jgi:hypothetical protein
MGKVEIFYPSTKGKVIPAKAMEALTVARG